MATYTLPELPYDLAALEPHYTAQVLEFVVGFALSIFGSQHVEWECAFRADEPHKTPAQALQLVERCVRSFLAESSPRHVAVCFGSTKPVRVPVTGPLSATCSHRVM